uniref:Sugar transferase n=1 Tax=Schlesneria paludicola TaxID=360056 RepID=A0A7C2P3W7_9PLAN
MSVSVLDEPAARGADLSDIFDHYLADESLPAPPWLTQLHLERPRRNTRCLGEAMRLWKRSTDIIGASLLLVLLSPVMLLVALLVKLSSPGPVIFRQVRVGLNQRVKKRDRRHNRAAPPPEGIERRHPDHDRRRDPAYGRPFVLYKFRTMCVDAEKNGAQLATKADPRVTTVGRFLRKARLDELPQLWNVLKGEMTLVGPRPERPEFIEKLSAEIPNYLNRLGLKPGLTGLAQIVNGYDNDLDSFRRKVSYDLMYLQNCCVWNDIKILFRTIGVVLTGSGAQ